MNKILIYLILTPVLLCLSGCNLFSSRIRAIGNEKITIYGSVNEKEIYAAVDVMYCEPDDPKNPIIDWWWYEDSYPEFNERGRGDVISSNTNNLKLQNNELLNIKINFNGRIFTEDNLLIRSDGYTDQYLFRREFIQRRWYGYPSQILLAVSIPIDIALDSMVFSGSLIYYPAKVLINGKL
jgi:hypothetical protein